MASTPAESSREAPPPGYRLAHEPTPTTDPGLPVIGFTALFGATVLLASHHSAVTVSVAYLEPIHARFVPAMVALGLTAAVLGGVVGRRRGPVALPLGLLLASLTASTSGPLVFLAFASGVDLRVLLTVLTSVLHLGLGLAVGQASRELIPTASRLGMVGWGLSPFRLLAAALAVGVVTAALGTVGPWRAAATVAATCALASRWSVTITTYLAPDRRLPWRLGPLSWGSLAVAGFAFLSAEAFVPMAQMARHNNVIVHASSGAHHQFVVTSGQRSFELTVDERLRVSTLDQARYFGALVHPTLSSAPSVARVLVLGGGTGLAEREVLEHPGVRSLTSVMNDAHLARIANGQRWLLELNGGALSRPEVSVVESEPVPFLERAEAFYDVIILDLPDPIQYADGKFYSVHFFRLVAARLSPTGWVVLQAASPFASPGSFAVIEGSLLAAGLTASAYRAGVPSFGDWGFLVAARGAPPQLDFKRAAERLSGITAAELSAFPKDSRSPAKMAPSRLFDGHIVEVFAEERHEGGP